jgi:hypothetical protein
MFHLELLGTRETPKLHAHRGQGQQDEEEEQGHSRAL